MREPLRIALLTHSVNPRGGVVHTLELGRALHAVGHQVTLFAPAAPGQRLFRPTPCEVQLVPIAAEWPESLAELVETRIRAYVTHLSRLLDERQFDVFHAQDGIGGNALADLEERGLIPGHLRTVHHLEDFADPRVMAWQRRALDAPNQLLCVSRLWREVLQRDYGLSAREVCNGVDTTRFQPVAQPGDAEIARRHGLVGDGPLILAVGGVEERKNSLGLLQGFIALRDTLPTARLVIAGGASLLDHDTYARRFHALAKAHRLDGSVHLTGPVPDADMPALFRRADVLALPSVNEGFGLVVLEALASGTPVVVSRIAPFTEYLDDALCHWAEPYDPTSIARALAAAANAQRGPDLVARAAPLLARFSWQRSASQHVSAYRAALSKQFATT
ncbi:MAG: MSMEG_0565 family glycosyltransferase [Zoogloeaceae bacterium]|nr:MSMEG_0565 family glycosyltransferase [Zoogloeaceae bacterium]